LTAIHGAVELILAGAYGPLDGEQRALVLEVLAKRPRDARRSCRTWRTLAHSTAAAWCSPRRASDVGAILDELRATLGEVASKRGVTFTLDAPPAGTSHRQRPPPPAAGLRLRVRATP
jgi:hypothetical protein